MAEWRYQAGLCLILVVVLIWVASAEVTQGIFDGYDHPFAITWLGASLLALLLPIAWVKERLCPEKQAAGRRGSSGATSEASTPRKGGGGSVRGGEANSHGAAEFSFVPATGTPPPTKSPKRGASVGALGAVGGAGAGGGTVAVEVEMQPPAKFKASKDKDGVEEERWGLLSKTAKKLSDPKKSARWSLVQIGMVMAPLWVLTEYLANASLSLTSVANTTILSSSAGLWTLLFTVALGQDSFNPGKLLAVVITIAGVVMTTFGKSWTPEELEPGGTGAQKTVGDARVPVNLTVAQHTLWGDALSLASAVCYGWFTVLLNKFSGEGDGGHGADVQKVFGFVGVFTFIGLWWLVLPLHWLGIEPAFSLPKTLRLDEALLANGLIGSMVSDYFWALSVVWTTPLVATLGMSLTIPVAMVSDVILHGRHYSYTYILGALQVFAGFCVANLNDRCSYKVLTGQL